MAAQKGSAFLVKMVNSDNVSPTEFTAIGAFRTKSMRINQQTVDATNQDSSNKWRELLEGAGIKSISLSGSGVFTDDTGQEYVRDAIMSGQNSEFQITVPGFGTFTGLFDVSEMSLEGPHDNAVTWSLTLESAGEIVFVST